MSALPLVSRVKSAENLSGLSGRLGRAGDRFVVKPNWFCLHPVSCTTAETLDLVLDALPCPVTVVESYTAMRHDDSLRITARDGRQHWAELREQDALFPEISRIGAVLQRHAAEYVDVTEEAWSGRVVPGAQVAALRGEPPA